MTDKPLSLAAGNFFFSTAKRLAAKVEVKGPPPNHPPQAAQVWVSVPADSPFGRWCAVRGAAFSPAFGVLQGAKVRIAAPARSACAFRQKAAAQAFAAYLKAQGIPAQVHVRLLPPIFYNPQLTALTPLGTVHALRMAFRGLKNGAPKIKGFLALKAAEANLGDQQKFNRAVAHATLQLSLAEAVTKQQKTAAVSTTAAFKAAAAKASTDFDPKSFFFAVTGHPYDPDSKADFDAWDGAIFPRPQ